MHFVKNGLQGRSFSDVEIAMLNTNLRYENGDMEGIGILQASKTNINSIFTQNNPNYLGLFYVCS